VAQVVVAQILQVVDLLPQAQAQRIKVLMAAQV
jgi:hypothetical protein